MNLKIKPAKKKCAYKNCTRIGEFLACGRESASVPSPHLTPDYYCEVHAEVVSDEGFPEYTTHCPNCGCRFGVN